MRNDFGDVLHRYAAVDDVIGVNDDVGSDVAEIDRPAIVDENLRVEAPADNLKSQSARDVIRAFLSAMRRRTNENVLVRPVHQILTEHSRRCNAARLKRKWRYSAVAILDAESSARVGPFNVGIDVTNDSTCAAFDTTFVGKQHSSVFLRGVAVGGTTIDTLLAGALETDVAIDDSDVSASAIDIVNVDRKLLFDRGGIKDSSSCS
jgi:hypothetical protein